MEMKENNQKKVLLSVLGVAILVVAVIGISFAAYSTVFTSEANTVTTGTIMVSYNESGNAINVTDAAPMSDATGKAQTSNGKFDFTVSTKADRAMTIPYEINLTKVTTGSPTFTSIADNQVKVYLTKGSAGVTETGTDGVLISTLANSTVSGRSGSKVLHTASDVFTSQNAGTAQTTNYTLRLWIDSSAPYDNVMDGSTVVTPGVSGKEYHAKVNVDSHVNPLS